MAADLGGGCALSESGKVRNCKIFAGEPYFRIRVDASNHGRTGGGTYVDGVKLCINKQRDEPSLAQTKVPAEEKKSPGRGGAAIKNNKRTRPGEERTLASSFLRGMPATIWEPWPRPTWLSFKQRGEKKKHVRAARATKAHRVRSYIEKKGGRRFKR